MSFDPSPPEASGLAGLNEWCRRDRRRPRLQLAAGAGDPVALAHLQSQLARPATAPDAPAAIEIVAARRSTRLIEIAGGWTDANDPALSQTEAIAWKTALRHLETSNRIDAPAALRGPLGEEARLVIDGAQPDMAPVSWASFCDRASFRDFPLDELRTIHRLGFVEPVLDVGLLPGRPAVLLRVLRGRWHQAVRLGDFIERLHVEQASPLDLAVWWEAVTQLDRNDLLSDRLGRAIVKQLVTEDEPQRWWPSVLAALTDWVVP